MTDYDINISGSNATITGSSLENALGKANFQVDITDAPADVVEGDTATVTAITFNSGGVQDTQTVELIVDAVTEDSVSLTLDGDSGSSDDYLWDTTGKSSGDYSASVESDDDSDSQTITVLSTIVWETETDWDNNQSENGVVHESVTNTDYDDASIIQKGYSAASPLHDGSLIRLYLLQEDDDNDGDDTVAYDFGGNNQDGRYYGAGPDATGVGSGLLGTSAPKFDGTDDYVSLPSLPSASGFTMQCWFNANDVSSEGRMINVRDNYDNILYVGRTSGKIGAYSDGLYDGITTAQTGTWYHVALTHDGSTLKVYVDGVEELSVSDTYAAEGTNDHLGAPVYDTTRKNFDGRIAFARFDTQALSQSQIQDIYNVVATDGTFTVTEKSFSTAVKPDLKSLDYSLNGVTDVQVDVIGSPNTVDEETVTQQLDGSSEYSLSWTDSHTDFKIKGYCESEGDVTRTSTYNKLVLVE